MGCLNKEKVIKALELEIKYPYTWDCKSECPYYNDTVCDCYTQLATDAIELLKEQHRLIEQLEHELAVTRAAMDQYVNGEWLMRVETNTLKHMGISTRYAAEK